MENEEWQRCPAYGTLCQYVAIVEQQAARIAKLERDHASVVSELNKTKALLKGYRRGFKSARQALGDK